MQKVIYYNIVKSCQYFNLWVLIVFKKYCVYLINLINIYKRVLVMFYDEFVIWFMAGL